MEATGFLAISKDRKLVALAFHELNTTGPSALELGIQLRSVEAERVVYAAKFREAYQGELGEAYLNKLRHRALAWVDEVNQRLAGTADGAHRGAPPTSCYAMLGRLI